MLTSSFKISTLQAARRSHFQDIVFVRGEVNARLNRSDRHRAARTILSEQITHLEMKGATSNVTQEVKVLFMLYLNNNHM